MKRTHACVLIAMSMHAVASASTELVCAARPEIVAPCFDVRGRLSFWNGTPSARIWRIGTTRMLGIHNDELPPGLATQRSSFDTELLGNFTVCPLTKRSAGHMQYVCIESWRDVSVRERSHQGESAPR
jgi:hypothetical protein